MLNKKVFTIDGITEAYIGYTEGKLWNGWATPFFELAEANVVMQGFNECAEFPMQYDEVYDQFYILNTETTELETWKGKDYITEDGIKHLYGIGAYSWVWDSVDESDLLYIAQKVDDFLYDYDTYEYRDNYDDRELVVKEIKNQLKDFNTLRQILNILHAEEMTEEERFNKLGEELKI